MSKIKLLKFMNKFTHFFSKVNHYSKNWANLKLHSKVIWVKLLITLRVLLQILSHRAGCRVHYFIQVFESKYSRDFLQCKNIASWFVFLLPSIISLPRLLSPTWPQNWRTRRGRMARERLTKSLYEQLECDSVHCIIILCFHCSFSKNIAWMLREV